MFAQAHAARVTSKSRLTASVTALLEEWASPTVGNDGWVTEPGLRAHCDAHGARHIREDGPGAFFGGLRFASG